MDTDAAATADAVADGDDIIGITIVELNHTTTPHHTTVLFVLAESY